MLKNASLASRIRPVVRDDDPDEPGLRETREACLRLPERRLRLHALGDVTDEPHDDRRRSPVQPRDRALDEDLGAISSPRNELHRPLVGGVVGPGDERFEPRAEDLASGLGNELLERLPQHVRPRAPEAPLRGRIELHDPSCVIDGDDGVERAPHDGCASNLALTKGRALPALAKLALDGGHQAPELVLEDVIVCARAHGVHGRLFSDGAGDDDEREVEPRLLQDAERPKGAELGHRPVADDEVPRPACEGGAHRRGFLHPLEHDLLAGGSEGLEDQLRIGRRVLDHEDAHRVGHGAPRRAGAGSFTSSQKKPKALADSANFANSTGFRT
jgi:hypothetical protein